MCTVLVRGEDEPSTYSKHVHTDPAHSLCNIERHEIYSNKLQSVLKQTVCLSVMYGVYIFWE
jgi:hypothetical protein